MDKFDSKSDEGIRVGYSTRSKAYRVYNKRTLTIEESMHVNFDENINKIINSEDEHKIIENNVNNSNKEENVQNKIEP